MKEETETNHSFDLHPNASDREGVQHQEVTPDLLSNDRLILRSLRRIIRAIDLYSRELKATCGLTVPQLVCLSAIVREKQITAVSLSHQVHLSPSTLVGILDRLEKNHLIRRERSFEDRRQVKITASEAGKDAFRKAPSPLQENLAIGLGNLSPGEQATIARSLDKIVELMEAHEIQVAPLLTLERKSYAEKLGQKQKEN